jgi:hypothetical protein
MLSGNFMPNEQRISHFHFSIFAIVTIVFGLSSCEGFKVLTLYNTSNSDAIVTTQPGLPKYDKSKIGSYPDNSTFHSSTLILKPDSSLILSEIFTGLVGRKMQITEQDLRINYLKIQTGTQIIEAKNKTEIIKLLTDSTTKYVPTTDTSKKIINSKNYGNIIIRH